MRARRGKRSEVCFDAPWYCFSSSTSLTFALFMLILVELHLIAGLLAFPCYEEMVEHKAQGL